MEENKQPQAAQPQKVNANLPLQQAIDTLQAEDTPENRKKMLGIAAVSRYLVPVTLTPPPPRDEAGRPIAQPDTQMAIQLLTNKEGQKYFMGFTSPERLAQWPQRQKGDIVMLPFDQFAKLLGEEKCPAEGLVIDPFSKNVTIPKSLVLNLQQGKERLRQIRSITKNDRVVIEDPTKSPDDLINALTAVCKKSAEVNAAFLRMMYVNGKKNYLLVLDLKEGDEGRKQVLQQLQEAAKPHLGSLAMGVSLITTDLGKKGAKDAKPFYKKMFYKLPDLTLPVS